MGKLLHVKYWLQSRTVWTAILWFLGAVLNEFVSLVPELTDPTPGFQWTPFHTIMLFKAAIDVYLRADTWQALGWGRKALAFIALPFVLSASTPVMAQDGDGKVSIGVTYQPSSELVIPSIGYKVVEGRTPEAWKVHWLVPDGAVVDGLIAFTDRAQIGYQAVLFWDVTAATQVYAGAAWLTDDLAPRRLRDLWDQAGLSFGLRVRL